MMNIGEQKSLRCMIIQKDLWYISPDKFGEEETVQLLTIRLQTGKVTSFLTNKRIRLLSYLKF